MADVEPAPLSEGHETSFVRLADAYRREGLVDDAIRICREGLAKFPGSLHGRIVLGQSLLDRGAIGEAVVELARVEREGRGDPAILASLCEVRLSGERAWPVGADLVREAASPAGAPTEGTPQAERVEPGVLILDDTGRPAQAASVGEASADDSLASSTLAGLYASQGDAATADSILRRIAPDDAPPAEEETPADRPQPAAVLDELTRLRRIAERLRRGHGRSTGSGR